MLQLRFSVQIYFQAYSGDEATQGSDIIFIILKFDSYLAPFCGVRFARKGLLCSNHFQINSSTVPNYQMCNGLSAMYNPKMCTLNILYKNVNNRGGRILPPWYNCHRNKTC